MYWLDNPPNDRGQEPLPLPDFRQVPIPLACLERWTRCAKTTPYPVLDSLALETHLAILLATHVASVVRSPAELRCHDGGAWMQQHAGPICLRE